MDDAEKAVYQMFERFKQLYPNSNETYVLSIENVGRWRWAIHEAEIRQSTEQQPFGMPDTRSAKRLAKSRSVGMFSRFPSMTKDRYMELAALFPGRRVYATGSRTTGEYIDHDSPQKVVRMRAELLKSPKKSSDYDITLDFMPGENIHELQAMLPTWADLIVKVPEGQPKIEIPMWDFTKLPPELHNEVVEHVRGAQWGKLMEIHNTYGLSETFFCCDPKPAQRWFTWAVENNIIVSTPQPLPEKPNVKKPKP